MRSERWALLFELEAPTGAHDDEERGVELPRALQLGSGDWTIGAGAAATWIDDRRRLALEAVYRHSTRHDGTRLGPTAELNAAFWYRLRPARFAPDSGPELRAVLELLGSHAFEGEIDGRREDPGSLVWLAPGLHYYPSTHVLLEANVQLPLFQDLDDALGERHWSANVVVKFLF
jgi:hypothetical protein